MQNSEEIHMSFGTLLLPGQIYTWRDVLFAGTDVTSDFDEHF